MIYIQRKFMFVFKIEEKANPLLTLWSKKLEEEFHGSVGV
jgi:hypothetical protein